MPVMIGVKRRVEYFGTTDHLRVKSHGFQRLLEIVSGRDSRWATFPCGWRNRENGSCRV